LKIEIDINLESDYDFHFKKHNNSKYTFEDLKPALIEYIKYQAQYYWMGDSYFQQEQHEKKIMDTIIHNTAFGKRDIVIVKTEEEQPIDDNSVVRLY
jgi:hypothetical protein